MTDERKIRHENACEVARKMMTAARTAPKSKGMDLIEIAMLEGDEIMRLSKEMAALQKELNKPGVPGRIGGFAANIMANLEAIEEFA